MAKISVIVPVYGVEQFLKEAVDSILSQTFTDLEIILIDDGSKDNCPQIIDEYAKKDNRIVAIHKQNGGYGSAMNVGLERATGEYIAMLEPDDYIDSKMYEDLYKIAKQYDSDIVKSCFYDNLQSKEETRILKVNWDDDKIPQNRSFKITECGLFLQYHPSIWSCIYKREFIKKHNIRFVEASGSGWTDNPFQVQTMCLAERINYTPNAYYYWRRLNRYESDDLKDYTIPFKRTDEIHKWLNDNNIDDDEILANLLKRELAYIKIVLGMRKISNKSDCYNRIHHLMQRYSADFCEHSLLNKNEIKLYRSIIKNPSLKRFALRFNRLRRNLISICWNRNEKFVRVCKIEVLRVGV